MGAHYLVTALLRKTRYLSPYNVKVWREKSIPQINLASSNNGSKFYFKYYDGCANDAKSGWDTSQK